MIEEATELASEPIAVLQIETHPYLDQTKVIAAARRHGMAVVGYCPLARGKVPGDETLQRIGRAHGKTPSQVALRFLEQKRSFRFRAPRSASGLRKISAALTLS